MSGPVTAVHRDRSIGLVVFGGVQVVVGLGSLATAFLTVAVGAVTAGLDTGTVLSSVLLYTAAAAVFVVLGVGSIRARRWACGLSLAVARVWLITGVLGMALLWLVAPTLWSDVAHANGVVGSAATAVAVVVNLILATVSILIPGAMVLFYRSPHVAYTCRVRDPSPTLIDRVPQRRLVLSVVMLFFALSIVGMWSYGWIFPCFGILLSGSAGAAAWIAVFAGLVALAWGILRGAMWAWWTATVGSILAAVSSAITFAVTNASVVLDAMNAEREMRFLLEALWPSNPWVHVVLWLAVWGSLTGYLVAVRRAFSGSASDSERS